MQHDHDEHNHHHAESCSEPCTHPTPAQSTTCSGDAHGHCHPEHSHEHARGRHHGHHHAYSDATGSRLLWASIINIVFTIVEVIGGLISNSLSLLSDALHNLADSSAIFVAYVAHLASKKKPTARKTFGFKRFEIIAAFLNAVVLIAVCIFLFVEAYHRFVNPQPIKGLVMLVVAIAGLVANLVSVVILQHDKAKNLNVKAAYLHLMGDTLSSVAVIIGGVCILFWDLYWLDPLITVLVGVYIIYHTWSVLRETTDILMQAVPPTIDLEEVKSRIESFPAVDNCHHIHIWRLNDDQLHLEAHLKLAQDLTVQAATTLRNEIASTLQEEFAITHITLQMEYGGCTDGSHHPDNCL